MYWNSTIKGAGSLFAYHNTATSNFGLHLHWLKVSGASIVISTFIVHRQYCWLWTIHIGRRIKRCIVVGYGRSISRAISELAGLKMSYSKTFGKDKVIFATKEDHEKPSTVELPETERAPGLILPNGEINWNCPCLGGMATGPCGVEFRDAFTCFHYRYRNAQSDMNNE